MYIERDIDSYLYNWKNENRRKPLLLRGVRQCGKTSAVRNLAKKFDSYIEINLEKQISLHSLFEGDIDISNILISIELESQTQIVAGKTLIFIDEIQACPRAITALRYFYEERPNLHIISAGSLLEFVLYKKDDTGKMDFPVGRVRSIYMYPFSFREFLRGIEQNGLLQYLDNYSGGLENKIAHDKLIQEYKTFLVVGGMPEAVAEYKESRSILACQRIHRDILQNMIDDFDKYDKNVSSDILRRVFEYSIHNVCSQTKASSAITGISAYYFEESIRLLRRAGLIFPVKATSCDTLPLGTSEKETNKKLIVFDTGIYLTECGLEANDILVAEVFDDLNKGDIVEMQTGLEIIKYMDAYSESSLYYWYRSGANAEIDYVIQKKNEIYPIEVKASKKGSMQSMYSFLKQFPKIPFGIRVSLENFSEYEKIHVYPVYAVYKIVC